MGRQVSILVILACTGLASAEFPSPCNPGTVGTATPGSGFNPYHPDYDFDGDGIPNSEDPDKDGDGVCDQDDNEVYTRPSENPNWDPSKPIPIWDNPESKADDRPHSDPSTFAADAEWLLSQQDLRGFDGGDNGGCPTYVAPYDCFSNPDGDGSPNYSDNDDDGDGFPDINDPDHPSYDADHANSDMDCDGTPNGEDDDIDGDGIPNECDPNPANMCASDTEPLPGPDCEDYGPGEPGDDPPPTRPPAPPPHDRPDPDPPDDDPDPPSPPTPPTPPGPPATDPPSDDACCKAICDRLDILIELGNQTVSELFAIHELAVENNYYQELLYKRLVSDPDSFRNRVDNGMWTIADLMQLVLHQAEYTNELLYYMADSSGGPTIPPPNTGPGGSVDPVGEARNFGDLVGSATDYGEGVEEDLEEWTEDWDPIFQFRQLLKLPTDEGSGEAPVWDLSIPMPNIGTMDGEPIEIQIDFAFYEPIRTPVFIMIYVFVLMSCIRMMWEELRRYG